MSKKVKILLVEENTPLAMFIVYLLARVGIETQVARTYEQGIQMARETKFDLFVVDGDSPGFDPFEICLELKQRHISRRTPLVFLTEENSIHDSFGVADCIPKPLEPTDFISRIISQARQTHQLSTAMH